MRDRLTPSEIDKALQELDGWSLSEDGNAITRQFRFADFGHHRQSRRGRAARCGFGRDIVEPVGQAVPDLVDRPPHHFLHFKAVRRKDAPCLGDDIVDTHPAIGNPFVLGQPVKLDV